MADVIKIETHIETHIENQIESHCGKKIFVVKKFKKIKLHQKSYGINMNSGFFHARI